MLRCVACCCLLSVDRKRYSLYVGVCCCVGCNVLRVVVCCVLLFVGDCVLWVVCCVLMAVV